MVGYWFLLDGGFYEKFMLTSVHASPKTRAAMRRAFMKRVMSVIIFRKRYFEVFWVCSVVVFCCWVIFSRRFFYDT